MSVLEDAARVAQHAPSIFNTQPWAWRLVDDTLELLADQDRRLRVVDPDGRLLMLSCGAALHHARTVLAASGWKADADRLCRPERPDLLARIRLAGEVPPDPEAQRMAAAITRRRTDRRAFADRTVSEQELTKLRRFVESEGAYLHVVRADQVAGLAGYTDLAARTELADPAYRAELSHWTSRPSFTGDGVPVETAVRPRTRRVPVRDFAMGEHPGLAAGSARDGGAVYSVVFGSTAEPVDLLRGGEALSALLLLAAADGLATAPLSDTVEVEWPRQLLRELLGGIGDPYVVVRLGHPATSAPLPPVPRRNPHEVITIV